MTEAKPKILIVEDEGLIAEEIAYSLENFGYDVCGHAINGDEALDLFATKNPNLVLLDINIKGTLSGIDLAKVIRKKYNFPFVFLTSYSDMETLNEVQETLPYGYIVKPFSEKNLKSNIQLALYKFDQEQKQGIPTFEELNAKLSNPIRKREYEIYILMYEGLTYREIGEKLFLSINTIKSYQKNLFQKLDVSSRNEAVRMLINL